MSSLPPSTTPSAPATLVPTSPHLSAPARGTPLPATLVPTALFPSVRHPNVRAVDLVVALELALAPGSHYECIEVFTGVSYGLAYKSVQRLIRAGLVDSKRTVRKAPLLAFLTHGVRHAFPATLGPEVNGVPTACFPHAAPIVRRGAGPRPERLAPRLPAARCVWPLEGGSARGLALMPFHPRVPRSLFGNRSLYDLLVLVDLVRVGDDDERQRALEMLASRLRPVVPRPKPARARW